MKILLKKALGLFSVLYIAFCSTPVWSANIASLAGPAVLRVPSSTTANNAALVLIIDAPAEDLEDENLVSSATDLKEAAPSIPVVTFGKPTALPLGVNQRRWVLPVTIQNMQAGIDQTRFVTVKIGGAESTLAYQITNASIISTWKLFPLPKPTRAINSEGVISLSIAVDGPHAVRDIQLAPTEFVEKSTGRTLANSQLVLCGTPTPCSGAGIDVPPGGKQLWIAPRINSNGDSPWIWPGQYEGVLAVSSEGKPAGESTNLTVFVSMWYWKLFGVGLLILGVFSAFYFTTVLRQRITRSRMLKLPVMLRRSITEITLTVDKLETVIKAPQVHTKLAVIEQALEDANLELNGLPGKIPLPWSDLNTEIQAYQTYLQSYASWVDAIRTIVDRGLVALVETRDHFIQNGGTMSEEQLTKFISASEEIDKMASFSTAPDNTGLLAQLTSIITNFETALGIQQMAPMSYSSAKAPDVVRTPKDLILQIQHESKLAWIFIGTATILAGMYILIFTNQGFGTPIDLLSCLLWGIGLPAGTALAASTPSSIATTLNVAH